MVIITKRKTNQRIHHTWEISKNWPRHLSSLCVGFLISWVQPDKCKKIKCCNIMAIGEALRFEKLLMTIIQIAKTIKDDILSNVIHGGKEIINYRVIQIEVSVKTKDIEIIKFTTNFNELDLMTGTYIFLPDCSRQPYLIQVNKLRMRDLECFRSNVGLL